MKAAQVAFAALIGVLIASSAVLFVADDDWPAWTFGIVGLFGFLVLLGMIVSDAAPRRNLPPPPR